MRISIVDRVRYPADATMADRLNITRDTMDRAASLFPALVDRFAQSSPDGHAILAWRSAKDPASLHHAWAAVTPLLAEAFAWDDGRTYSMLQAEFLFALHVRLLAEQMPPRSGQFD